MISRYASTNLLRTSVNARNDTLAFCISSITWGSSTPGTPRSNLVARSVDFAWAALTLCQSPGIHAIHVRSGGPRQRFFLVCLARSLAIIS